MNSYRSEPGASTPYPAINRLLDIDERYRLKWTDAQNYLLMPKSIQKLSALLFLLHEQGVKFSLSRKYLQSEKRILISLQSINKVKLLENDAVEVQAGYELEELHRWLFEQGREVGWDNISGCRLNMREAIQHGKVGGLTLRRISIRERLISLEMIKSDGGILKLGNSLSRSTAGPAVYDLFWGLEDAGAVLINAVFKTERIPPVRLYLSWEFEQRNSLWSYFHSLMKWTSTWERLDCLVPRDFEEKCFIIGQISGTKAEMDEFKNCCPYYSNTMHEDKFNIFKNYFIKSSSVYEAFKKTDLKEIKGDYLWYHGLTDTGCFIHKQKAIIQEKQYKKSLWKERLKVSLL